MPTISPSLVPSIAPGNIFDRFTEDTTLNVRFLTAQDPVFFEATNRPMADITLRQLIIAKAIDDLNTALGAAAIFPFLIPPRVTDGSSETDVPVRLFWDMHSSVSNRWANLRLARVDRLDGENPTGGTEGATGTLRMIFTANETTGGVTGTAEIAIFYADYEIDSTLDSQRVNLTAATADAVPGLTPLDPSETLTVGGFLTFQTLDPTGTEMAAFLELVAPGLTGSESYEITDGGSTAGAAYDTADLSHGTGLLADSAVNLILALDSDPANWIDAFNHPFGIASTLESDTPGLDIPRGLFREMDITAPAGDAATGDVSGTTFPVWINRIESDGSATVATLIFYFATYPINPVDPSTIVEFGSLTLQSDMVAGQVVAIVPDSNLYRDQSGSGFDQDFGRGHVTLSGLWGITGGEVDEFFTTFPIIVGTDTSATFGLAATRIAHWGVSRVPKYSPTAGQAAALEGTASDRDTSIPPSSTNKYVTSGDEGLGDSVNLDNQTGIDANPAINTFGNTATRAHALIKLVVDPSAASGTMDPDFYDDEILPRLRILLGRDPVFGDMWYNGNRFVIFNGDAWVD